MAAVDWVDYRRRREHSDEAFRLLATIDDPDPETVGLVLMEHIEQEFNAGQTPDPALVERALDAERRAPSVNVADRFSAALGPFLKYMDRLDEARQWIERTSRTAIDEGDEGSLAYAASHLPELELWSGHWDRAEEAARRHLELAVEFGLESQRRQAIYNLSLVLAHRGAVDEARRLLDDGLRAAADGDDWTTTILTTVVGFIELSLGDMHAAATTLRRASTFRDAMNVTTPRRHDPDLVEALLGIGNVSEARTLADTMLTRAAESRRASAIAIAERSAGLVAAASGDFVAGLAALERAMVAHSAAPFPFDRARTLLAIGQVQRRRRERRASKEAFEAALEAFVVLGAPLWVQRARSDLARVGLRRTAPDLTEGERRVAELVAGGLTNREVAAALFVSPKTVEANLARVYAKLGVHSRAQLARANIGIHPMPEDRPGN